MMEFLINENIKQVSKLTHKVTILEMVSNNTIDEIIEAFQSGYLELDAAAMEQWKTDRRNNCLEDVAQSLNKLKDAMESKVNCEKCCGNCRFNFPNASMGYCSTCHELSEWKRGD